MWFYSKFIFCKKFDIRGIKIACNEIYWEAALSQSKKNGSNVGGCGRGEDQMAIPNQAVACGVALKNI